MPQVLKDEVRERILAAALEVFAAEGYPGATMGEIARRAGLGTASLYRYYASKEELFDAVVPAELAERFGSLLGRRVEALARLALGHAPAPPDDLGEEMLRFWDDHRLAVVTLLDRAEGTPHAHFGQEFVDQLIAHTTAHLAAAEPPIRPAPTDRFVLRCIFESTRRTLAAILEAHADRHAMREAIAAFWSYQIAGLRALTERMAARPATASGLAPARPRRPSSSRPRGLFFTRREPRGWNRPGRRFNKPPWLPSIPS